MIEEQVVQLNAMLEVILNDEDFMPNMARLMRKFYDELIKVGFTKEQAVKMASNYKAT